MERTARPPTNCSQYNTTGHFNSPPGKYSLLNWKKKKLKQAMLSNFLFPRNGRVVLSLLRLSPIAITWGHYALLSASPPTSRTPTPPPTTQRLRTSPPAHGERPRRPPQPPIAVHPPPPPPRTQAFPSTRCGFAPPYIKTNVGGEEALACFGDPPVSVNGEEATRRPFQRVLGGSFSLPTALGVRVLWLRRGRKRREWG